ncbi:hypothetical protein Plhal710r2_c033g0122381 [Plasmopara halstedii]
MCCAKTILFYSHDLKKHIRASYKIHKSLTSSVGVSIPFEWVEGNDQNVFYQIRSSNTLI